MKPMTATVTIPDASPEVIKTLTDLIGLASFSVTYTRRPERPSPEGTIEQNIIRLVSASPRTARELQQGIPKVKSSDIQIALQPLLKSGRLKTSKRGRTMEYAMS